MQVPSTTCEKKLAREEGKQKDAPPASRKQLNTETDDNGEGKQKGAPKGGKTKTKDAGKGKQDGKPSGAKLATTDDGKEKRNRVFECIGTAMGGTVLCMKPRKNIILYILSLICCFLCCLTTKC